MNALDRLEADSIHVFREVAAECDRPVLLYSGGKDSAVLLRLAQKAFFPVPPPFPMLHVDTTWKFQEMYSYRDRMAQAAGMELIVHRNPEALARGINPFDHGALHTDLWKTEGLKQALNAGGFDAASGGARRDEERSRAKERVLSFRSATHGWDPRNQRPELWSLFNTRKNRGESLRAFPLSDWTELDVWRYIRREDIPVASLYFATERPVVERNRQLLVIDDARFPIPPGEVPQARRVRFRTLGCYPLTGAIESDAATVDAVIDELIQSPSSERAGRAIDAEGGNAEMERRKQEGYF